MTSIAKSDYTVEPAQGADLYQFLEIYTYYVLNTTISLPVHTPDLNYICSRYQQTLQVGLLPCCRDRLKTSL